MKKTFLLVIAALMVVGCETTQGGGVLDLPAPKSRKVHIDERLLTECPQLENFDNKNPKPSDVLQQHGKDAKAYAECAKSKKKLIDAVRTAFPQSEN